MPVHFLLEALLGLVPVLLFLAGLLYLDSFKLVDFKTVLGVMALGALAALASYLASGGVMDALHIGFPQYSRYAAPFVEEGFKAAVIIWLFSRNRIGFMVDAAILGVAVGAGFSLFENVYYAYVFPEANVGVWMVRGFGTAIMHGGVAAIFAVTAQILRERHSETGVLAYLPGFLLAVSLHSIFNQFVAWPLYSAAATIVALPLVLLFVFDKSEHEVHNWLVQDYQTHEQLLEAIRSGAFTHSEAARFIQTLSSKFSPAVVTDIFAYVRLHSELVVRAEKILLAKEAGTEIPLIHADSESFSQLHALEGRIGPTAMLTIWPHLKFSHQELFELHLLEQRAHRVL
jgi:RsiW-degrading membrane proteinase PrsW (M82 family)